MEHSIEELRKIYAELCATEAKRMTLIEGLFAHIDGLQLELKEAKCQAEEYKRLSDSYRGDYLEYEKQYQAVLNSQAKLNYVSVLIDGDSMNFQESLVRGEESGGNKAAHLLIKTIQTHLRTVDRKISPDIAIRIRVYANVEGLSKAYRSSQILESDSSMRAFIHGFNKDNRLCDMVDVGYGKECADRKLEALFVQDIRDVHCRRVIFCASTDNGYARVLKPYLETGRISLGEGPPFAREMQDLAETLPVVSFEDVFMKEKLRSERRGSFGTYETADTPPRTPTRSYASAAARAALSPQPASPLMTTTPASTATLKGFDAKVYLNAKGQRVDRSLTYPNHVAAQLRRDKLCNRFHLLGDCFHGDQCTHKHGESLSQEERVALTAIARQSVCTVGFACRDEKCTSGHRCPWGDCFGRDCKFPASMHNVDIRIV
ncbi:CCCH zinc finger DNA binding protein [Aspergillus uvarum CBS 121591]|uniref:CCCH zinc finger DNA binding protein n=1 Tax=Aspergillus uvarum CBS 121591 TaxID=1448315 RepID=A0A319C8W9_9EURO|nr:CCCH zinc finger DNA binding protein [Aspergillus uvarum CBS 121591]PYH81875.1 CCCH zinc finger DNA binding protein [Aspergillus uvarum CBS 121591]